MSNSIFFQEDKHFSGVAFARCYPPVYGPDEGTIEYLLLTQSE